MKYVCVFRNPEEPCVSFYKFLKAHNPVCCLFIIFFFLFFNFYFFIFCF